MRGEGDDPYCGVVSSGRGSYQTGGGDDDGDDAHPPPEQQLAGPHSGDVCAVQWVPS